MIVERCSFSRGCQCGKEYPHLAECRLQQEGKATVVYEPRSAASLDAFGFPGSGELLRSEEFLDYEGVLRFVLLDKKTRQFRVERLCYRSSVDGWMTLGTGHLGELAAAYLPHVGKESFFDLWEWSPVPSPPA